MTELELLDWRRQTFALYAGVRSVAEPERAHQHWVTARTEMIASHPVSPRRGSRIVVAAYDPTWRFAGRIEPADPLGWEVPTGTDGIVPFERVGTVRLRNDDRDAGSLDLWALRSYGGGLFLPVKDAGAGRTSYGGGRYLLDTVKGADLGNDGLVLTVDLNFAYNPSCAYDEAWACPLAPPGNVLVVEVPVGEGLPG
jgi:uncharacterized protein (DUF1684 family)